jgi:SAM-dependent methyltransferase
VDRWKYFGITHRDLVFCNPLSEQKFDELVSLLRLPPNGRVLDIACGKAELLRKVCARYGARGVGTDISPYEVADALRTNVERGLDRRIGIIEGGGAEYQAEPEPFDLAMCIGATWVWHGFAGTLEALKRLTRPGGLVAIGEPFKLKEPEPEYIEAAGAFAARLATHYDNCRAGETAGLSYLYSLVSSEDDWDRYMGHTNRDHYPVSAPVEGLIPGLHLAAKAPVFCVSANRNGARLPNALCGRSLLYSSRHASTF